VLDGAPCGRGRWLGRDRRGICRRRWSAPPKSVVECSRLAWSWADRRLRERPGLGDGAKSSPIGPRRRRPSSAGGNCGVSWLVELQFRDAWGLRAGGSWLWLVDRRRARDRAVVRKSQQLAWAPALALLVSTLGLLAGSPGASLSICWSCCSICLRGCGSAWR
jgi:hypothetical protein